MDKEQLKYIKKAIKGDKNSFNHIIASKNKDILYIAHYFSNATLAEDCAQEAVIKMMRGISALRAPEKFDAWMFLIIKRTCFTMLKKESKNTYTDIDNVTPFLSEENIDFCLRNLY